MQNVNDVRAADRLRIVDSRLVVPKVLLELMRALVGDELHVIFRAEFQAAGRARFDARRFQTLADAIGAKRALVDFFGRLVELGDVEGATGSAELTADAVFLLEIHDAIRVLHNGAVGWTRPQTPGIGAVHALILAHQPLNRAVFTLVLIELDEVPEVPTRFGHRLVGVVEGRFPERHIVPLDARHLAGLASNARRGID